MSLVHLTSIRSANRGSRFLGLLLGLLLCLLPAVAQALCVCGYSDGLFTVDQAMTMDGNMSDWAAVLADTDNNVCDGGLDNAGVLYEPQPDLDAPVQSTGRDLLHFAYTWDDNGVNAYTARAASQSNTQTFIYYADADNDGFMETGERVILVSWQGNNGTVKVYYGTYEESAGGGDPMVDGSGMADGYTLPGRILNVAQRTTQPEGKWGASDGLSMEWSASWTDLGVPPRAAFTFHVSSTNASPNAGSLPGQVDDNMGGCGGGPVSSQFADLTFTPDQNLQGIIGGTVYAAHLLTNTGNGTDTFNLSSVLSGSLSPTLSYYHDQDSSGTFTSGDTPLVDTDGYGMPDTGALASGTSIELLIGYTLPGTESGSVSITITGTSSYDSNRSAIVTDSITVTRPILTIIKSVSGATAQPGDLITYTVQVLNAGDGDAANVVLDDRMSPYTAWQLDYNYDGAPEEPFSFAPGASGLSLGTPDYSRDNGSTWGAVPASGGGGMPAGYDGTITNWRLPMTGTMAVGGSFTLRYKVLVK